MTMFCLLALAIATQEAHAPQIPMRTYTCAVVPISRTAKAREELLAKPDFNSADFQKRWIVSFDDDACYLFSRTDPGIQYYSERKQWLDALATSAGADKTVKLSDLPEGMQAKVLDALGRMGPLPKNTADLELGIGVDERFFFSNSNRRIEANLRASFGTPPALDEAALAKDYQPTTRPTTPTMTEIATEGLSFVLLGQLASHKSQAVLAGRAFKQYADLVKKLQEESESAARALLEVISAKGDSGPGLNAVEPKRGDQIDTKKRRYLLARGIDTKELDGIDDTWLKDATIDDHYYVFSFALRYADEKGEVHRGTQYGIPVRLKG